MIEQMEINVIVCGGQDSGLGIVINYVLKGTGFNPRLDQKKHPA
jgi:hypothetical protein